MVSLRQLAHKLQTALCQKGRYIKLNQHQAYSPKRERMVTKYVLQEVSQASVEKRKDITILETYQLADVVKKLAEIYTGGDGD